MLKLKNTTPEWEVTQIDRPSSVILALHYNVLPIRDVEKYKPHVLMFGRKHIGTILQTPDRQWQLYNKKNFRRLNNRISSELKPFFLKGVVDILDLIYPLKGRCRDIFDPIPDPLLYMGLSVTSPFADSINIRSCFTKVVSSLIPNWMHSYKNMDCLRYNPMSRSYSSVSLNRISEVEGDKKQFDYQNFSGLLEQNDYSIYITENL